MKEKQVKVSNTEETKLDSFNWEETSEESFFGSDVATEDTEDTAVIEEVVEDVETVEKTEEELKKEKEDAETDTKEDTNFFEETSATEEGATTKSNDEAWQSTFKEYQETGLFKHVELEEGEELTEERFFELQEEEYETEVSERLKTWATDELDDDARAFIKFKTEGGKTVDFFNVFSKGSDIPEGDIDKEEYQDTVIRYQLSEEGWDKEEIEDRLEYLTSNGKKEKMAKKYEERISTTRTAAKEAVLSQAKEIKTAQKANEISYKKSIQTALDEAKELQGFKVSAKDKTNLLHLLTKKDHKVGEKSITGFQKKLAEVFQDPNKMILLAKIVDSDFDMTAFEKATATKTTRTVKKNIEQRKSLRTTGSGSSTVGNTLAELF